jgi:Mg/Co/Ni transporter MgtE
LISKKHDGLKKHGAFISGIACAFGRPILPTNATRMEFGTYSFFLVPFFLKFLGFLPAVIGSQMISTRRGIPS